MWALWRAWQEVTPVSVAERHAQVDDTQQVYMTHSSCAQSSQAGMKTSTVRLFLDAHWQQHWASLRNRFQIHKTSQTQSGKFARTVVGYPEDLGRVLSSSVNTDHDPFKKLRFSVLLSSNLLVLLPLLQMVYSVIWTNVPFNEFISLATATS